MKSSGRSFLTTSSLKDTLITIAVLITGLLITFISMYYSWRTMREVAINDFKSACNEIALRIDTRLDEHAQLLRSGAGLFAASDSVSREQWRDFNEVTKINKYLPGIEGFGYSQLVHPDELQKHISLFRASGFPNYTIYPEGKREVYSSIIYLEPFSGRNLRAFGYDMFSEPVRRKAMQQATDSNDAMLSGKVFLVQESPEPGEDLQAGVLMYVPVYKNGMAVKTVEQRRAAIQGWVYSPYRMKDLMHGIMGNGSLPGEGEIQFKIYDDIIINEDALLFDSYYSTWFIGDREPNIDPLVLHVVFNGRNWTIVFTGRKEKVSIFHPSLLVILSCGIVISFLLFSLSTMQLNASLRRRQIEQLNEQLERANQDKDRFIAVLSHDLKSPFTSILGFLELLTDDIRQFTIDQIEHHVNIINDAARNFYSLLEDLLMWTRANSGKIPFNPQILRFSEIYDNVMEILNTGAAEKQVSINYYAEGDVEVFADQDMLKAVLRNIVSNAIKFTMPGGSIKVAAENKPGSTTVSVSDTGVGISPEQVQSLFDISKTHSTTGTSKEKGSGLGLILCKEFIEKHGGTIEVKSISGKGSEFRFTLPFKPENKR